MVQFAQAGEVDFIEIARRADQALGRTDDPSELLLKLDASIRHLLIDEFQDTSQSQIDLLKKSLQDGSLVMVVRFFWSATPCNRFIVFEKLMYRFF